MRKGLLIYNPRSGLRKVAQELDSLLDHALDQDIYLMPVRLKGEDTDFIRSLLKESWVELVVASGGDGSLSNIVQMVLEERPELPIGFIPGGTSNDFCDSLGIPDNLYEAIDYLAKGKPTAIDCGLVNDKKLFLSSCAAGMFVNISFSTPTELKNNLGLFAYYFTALGELPKIRSFPLTVEYNGGKLEEDCLLFLIINGQQAAGVSQVFKDAQVQDGLMDLLVLKKPPTKDLAKMLVEVVNREAKEGKYLIHIQSDYFKFSTTADILTTQDGEKGIPMPFEVKVLKQAINILLI